MITYLVNFTLCSALMLLAYQLLLKNKAMYRFNRAYLIGSLVFALLVPLIVVEQKAPVPMYTYDVGPQQHQQEITTADVITELSRAPQTVVRQVEVTPTDYTKPVLWSLYALVSAVLLYRFVRNLAKINAMIRKNKTVAYHEAWLVLIPQRLTPHTFLDRIFLNHDEYQNHEVDEVILHHELAHARQYHTADIILLELLQIFCWFNPVLLLYRRAIKLNHEFLADDAVLNAHYNVVSYQQVLVGKLADMSSLGFTSQFNYSVTKKRLMMMTKKTSATAAWVSRLAIMPVLIVAFMLFCTKTDAVERMVEKVAASQTDPIADETDPPVQLYRTVTDRNSPHTEAGVSQALVDDYKSIEKKYGMDDKPSVAKFNRITAVDKARLDMIYRQMSPPQQMKCTINFYYERRAKFITDLPQHVINGWAAKPKYYGIWLNGKRIKNSDLANYTSKDISIQTESHLTTEEAKGEHFKIKLEFMTKPFFTNYVKELLEDPADDKMGFHVRFPSPTIKNATTSQLRFDTTKLSTQGEVPRFPRPGFTDYPHTEAGVSAELLAEYQTIEKKYSTVKRGLSGPYLDRLFTEQDKARMIQIYSLMSLNQQKQQMICFGSRGKPQAYTVVTRAQLDDWAANGKKYGIYLNYKRVPNDELNKYKPEEIGLIFAMHHTNTKTVEAIGYSDNVTLMTKEFYADIHKKEVAEEHESFVYLR